MPMSTITSLWAAGRLPIHDGLYTAAGEQYNVRINPAKPGGIEILDKFDLDAFLKSDPDWLTTIDITGEVELRAGAGWLCRGEGSYGSEGFFAHLNQDKNLVWVVYLEESNPFVDITVAGNVATFTSSSDIRISVDIARPWAELPDASIETVLDSDKGREE
jgi:hypothetical protein